MWAKNGDVISLQYTGTESNITRVTTKNKQGVIGKLEQWRIGVDRYVQHLTHDQFKQACVETITDKQRYDILSTPRFLSDMLKPYGFQGQLRLQMKAIQGDPTYGVQVHWKVRVGVLVVNAENFAQGEEQAKEVSETARIRRIIRDCLAKQELDIIAVGLTFGELFANENEDGAPKKGGDKNDKSRFIDEMLEEFSGADLGGGGGAPATREKHIAVCYKEKRQQLVFVFARSRLIPFISDVTPIKQVIKKDSVKLVVNLSFRLYG